VPGSVASTRPDLHHVFAVMHFPLPAIQSNGNQSFIQKTIRQSMKLESSQRNLRRLVPAALLGRYFATRGVLPEIDWEALPKWTRSTLRPWGCREESGDPGDPSQLHLRATAKLNSGSNDVSW
jgi:hypothetical protein